MRKKHVTTICAAAIITAVIAGCGSNTYTTVVNSEAPAETEEETEEAFSLSDDTTYASYTTREETVNVTADADGTPREITVETKLSGIGDGDALRDRTDLTDIKNHHGDEEWIEEEGSVLWQNLGEDIVYEGTTDRELPVAVKVTYYLDGEEITPEALAGKSGRVKIRFDYENREKRGEAYVPFVCISAATLSSEVFSDITVTNGRLLAMDDMQLAVGMAMPGLRESLAADGATLRTDSKLPEYVEIEADAEDFELDFTATIVTNGLFSEETDEGDQDALREELEELLGASIPDFSDLSDDADGTGSEINVSRETGAIKNHLSALSQEIMASPTLSAEEKAAMLSELDAVGSNFRSLGSKLSGLGASLSDSMADYEELSDALEDLKERRDAIREADRSYTSFAGTPAAADSSVRFLIETDGIGKEESD